MEEKDRKNIVTFHKYDDKPISASCARNPKKGIVEWGTNNNYGAFLIDLYNNIGSVNHKAIIERKVRLTTGQGLVDIADPQLKEFVDRNKIPAEFIKWDFDLEIFGGFAVLIIWDTLGENILTLKHVALHKLRFGIPSDKLPEEHFWFSNDWLKPNKWGKPEYIKAYDKYKPGGRQLLYVRSYNPDDDGYYPVPSYSLGLLDIQSDYRTSQYNFKQLKRGYFPAAMVNFKRKLDPEVLEQFLEDFDNTQSGTENAASLIITQSDHPDDAPEFIPILPTVDSELFLNTSKRASENVIAAHGLPPALMLVSQSVFNNEDRTALMREFQLSYINQRQALLEDSINGLLDTDQIKLKTYLQEETTDAKNPDGSPVTTTDGVSPEMGAVNEHIKAMTGKQMQQMNRIIRQYLKEQITEVIAIHQLMSGFGLTESEAKMYLGIEDVDDKINGLLR